MKDWTKFTSPEVLDQLRGRDLKRLLLDQLGASSEIVSKTLDRKDLKILAWKLINAKRAFIQDEEIITNMAYTTVVVLVLGVLYNYREFIYGACFGFVYNVSQRLANMRIAYKHGAILSWLLVGICLLMEFLNTILSIRTLLSWVLPRELLAALFAYLPIPSFPIQADSFTGGGDVLSLGSRGSNRKSSGSGLSVDVGPMVTIYLLNLLQSRIENYANQLLLARINDNNRRRHST